MTPTRDIGPLAAVAIVAGSMLGTGILLTPPIVATHVPSLWGFAGLWVLGAVVAASGGLVYAELATFFSESGGDVVYLERTYGRTLAAAVGLVVFVGGFAGSAAALAVALGTYQLQTLLSAFTSIDLSASYVGVSGSQGVGAGLVFLLTALNLLGVRWSARVQLALTAVPLVGLAGLALWGAAIGVGDVQPAVRPISELGTAWMGVYFAYAGWPAVVYVAGEVNAPHRTLPVAILGGTALIAATYALLCFAFIRVLGFEGLSTAGEAGTALAAALAGDGGAVVAAGLVAAALLASINATLLGGARLLLAMARAWNLHELAVVDQNGNPHRLLVVQAVVTMAFCLYGSFGTLLMFTTMAMLVAGTLTVSTQVVLRTRQPSLERGFRDPWFPVPALVYILSAVVALGLTLLN